MRITFNEMDKLLIPVTITGVVMLLGGVFLDNIAQHFQMSLSMGFGIWQLGWCLFWGVFVTAVVTYNLYYGA